MSPLFLDGGDYLARTTFAYAQNWDAECRVVYAGNDPRSVHTVLIYSPTRARPWWTYVTQGMSALVQDEGNSPFCSEILARTEAEATWVPDLLLGLACYPSQYGVSLHAGQTVNAGGPIDQCNSTYDAIYLATRSISKNCATATTFSPAFASRCADEAEALTRQRPHLLRWQAKPTAPRFTITGESEVYIDGACLECRTPWRAEVLFRATFDLPDYVTVENLQPIDIMRISLQVQSTR